MPKILLQTQEQSFYLIMVPLNFLSLIIVFDKLYKGLRVSNWPDSVYRQVKYYRVSFTKWKYKLGKGKQRGFLKEKLDVKAVIHTHLPHYHISNCCFNGSDSAVG